MIARFVRVLVSGLVVALLLIGSGALQRVGAQTAPSDSPGIVAAGFGMASAPAATATVQLFVSSSFYGGMGMVSVIEAETPPDPGNEATPVGDSGWSAYPGDDALSAMPAVLTAADVAPVVDALVGAGIGQEAIEIVSSAMPMYGPGGPQVLQIRFEVANPVVADLAELVGTAREAALGAGLSLDFVGVTYGGADCVALAREAQAAAVADARQRAEGLAAALGVELGDLVQAADYSYGPTFDDASGSCGPRMDPSGGYTDYGYGVPLFDPRMPAEVVVYASVTLVYAFGAAEPTA
jgi:uncharacterized protein YggE